MGEGTWIDDYANGIIADLGAMRPDDRNQVLRLIVGHFMERPDPIAIGLLKTIAPGGTCPQCGYISVSYPFCPVDGSRLVEAV